MTSKKEFLVYKSIIGIATLSFSITTLMYIYSLFNKTEIISIIGTLLLIIGFGLLSYNSYLHYVKNKTLKEQKSSEKNVLDTYGHYGYIVMTIYFILALFYPDKVGIYINYYTYFGIFGYLLLAINKIIGIYLISAFYILSIISTIQHNAVSKDIILFISKIGLLSYYLLYSYSTFK
jgi:uncharacterized membrane protein YidH (DUF202 family)